MFQAKAPEAFEVLCKHLHAKDPRVSVAAATQILDRAYGRPVQAIDTNITEDNSAVRVYVPKPCKTTEEWLESIRQDELVRSRSMATGVVAVADDEQRY